MSPQIPQHVTIEWSIAQVDGVDLAGPSSSSLAREGSTQFPINFNDSSNPQRELGDNNNDGTSTSTSNVETPPVQVYNTSDSPHYTALLTSLSSAKDTLNARLTEWKDVIGDKEKTKEVLPPGTAGQKGMGKAMMMVQAAKQTDGRAGQAEQGAALAGSGVESGGSVSGRGGAAAGLPTDDQESDEDDDADVAAVLGEEE
ncbi:hypothetical protein FFLO_07041 [Filobasidium floriforme]|uniref:Uncharacterized protein n=1 Tax=Filobasidium floriforme TaxID=5210 RepID=A0A8K0JE30_9TREE|nr:hypothetical protein FFLO_07041 [Filobasidium floriforme]